MGSFTVISRLERQAKQHEVERERLLAESAAITADWRTEASIDEISDEDRDKLKAWLAYNKAVKSAVAGEAWPPVPES
ncbi:tail fiber assembly protein [Cedecea neteri]|uniref:tail fiber assembly protein n=1 Tax=Cedecea neteri TaxID=158822 RepID=UPI002AA92A1F|nr:tail fiber assembly protein [Cedecea neteri]WPU24527.1 tail fiber assembly protein [Cedecea neteri]